MIDRIRASTHEVGGRLLEMSGAQYMVRGLGYIHSLKDLADIPVATKNGTAVLVSDLGTVAFGPDIRQGVAEWQGEGETVGGIVVMRYGMNALKVINGVKKKIAEIAPSLPPGVQIRTAYDRSGLAVMLLVPVLYVMLKERALSRGTLRPSTQHLESE